AIVGLVASLLWASPEIKSALSSVVNRYSLLILLLILVFFVAFSILFLPKTELIFFDENLYQGTALNILNNGNALICWFGTQYVHSCFSTELSFDPAGWPFLIAVAFKLFGIGNTTTYNLELFLGALSITSLFFISGALTNRKEAGPIAAAIFVLVPELFIWSNTLANPDMPFLAFACVTILLFLIFIKKSSKRTLLPFVFALVFTIYLRVEAVLLVPALLGAFLVLGDRGIKETFRRKIAEVYKKVVSDSRLLLLLVVFVLLIEPQIYTTFATTAELQANAAFYLYPNTPIFSPSYVAHNLSVDLSFLAGMIKAYPIIFIPNITILAVVGIALSPMQKKDKRRFAVILVLAGLFLIYFVFYLFYFSGSVFVGNAVRYLLILYPPLAILAALGILGTGDLLSRFTRKERMRYAIYGILVLLLFAVPFALAIPFLTHPTFSSLNYPVNNVTANLPGVNPYTTNYSKTDLDFIENNYQLVPNKCLVVSALPSVWFMLNRSSAYLPNTDIFTNSSYSGYGCYYLDYDFWCTVSPYNSTICNFYTTNYKLKVVATESTGRQSNFTLYQILNYTGNST
ncbi:MAG TPA: glycosyltransferase family 39 protein, partial [Candidatus Acidoferrum sp.]|nr:glycosyltransferase family 39 protein [Candidatus Acidoferrum sp.]